MRQTAAIYLADEDGIAVRHEMTLGTHKWATSIGLVPAGSPGDQADVRIFLTPAAIDTLIGVLTRFRATHSHLWPSEAEPLLEDRLARLAAEPRASRRAIPAEAVVDVDELMASEWEG